MDIWIAKNLFNELNFYYKKRNCDIIKYKLSILYCCIFFFICFRLCALPCECWRKTASYFSYFSNFHYWCTKTLHYKWWSMGIVYSLKIYEHNKIASDLFIIFLNDHKPILSCFIKKENLSLMFHLAQMQSIIFQKFRFNYTKGRKTSSCWYVEPSFYSKTTATKSTKTQTFTSTNSLCNTYKR